MLKANFYFILSIMLTILILLPALPRHCCNISFECVLHEIHAENFDNILYYWAVYTVDSIITLNK